MDTIKAKYLRIGNWVNKANGIDGWDRQVSGQDIADLEYSEKTLIYRTWVPISLNKDWLLHFDFKLGKGADLKLSEFDEVYWIEGLYFIEIEDDEFVLYRADDENTYWQLKRMKYVHELQNIYSDLENEELTINK